MAEAFDPYHKWLGISPKDQPPNHYRLLGIELFESDPDVVEGAADQRMAHVRTFQTGQNSALSQRILNELSAAKLCLLDASRRAEYDGQLHAKLQEAAKASEPQRPPAAPAPRPLPQAKPLPVQEPAPIVISGFASPVSVFHKRAVRKGPAWRQPAVLAGAGVAILLCGAAIYFFSSGSKANVAQANRPSAPAMKINDIASPAPEPAKADLAKPDPAKPVAPLATVGADFEIIDASWGAGETWVDVTEGVRKQVKDHRLVTMVWSNLFGSPEDPAKGVEKKLRIQYRARGRVYSAEYPDYFFVYLDGNPLAPPTDAPDGLELLEARYGAGESYLDVLPQARERIRDGRFSVAEDEFYNKDVVPEGKEAGAWAGAFKVLWVRYRNATGEHFAYAWNSQLLTIDCRPPHAAGPPIDLLKLVDVQRDAVQGEWRLDDKGLVAPGGMHDRLQLPADVPDEYVLTVVAEADGELRDVSVGLPIGGRQVICCLDGFQGLSSGLNKVNDAWLSDASKNPTFSWRMSRLLEQGRPNTLTFIVSKTSLRVLRDGAELVRWSGDPQTFSLSPEYEVPDPRCIYLQSYDSPFRVTRAELAPLAPAKSEMLVGPEPNQSVDLLAGIDLERDVVRGDWRLDGRSLLSPREDRGALQLPAVLPESYRLELVAARESGDDCLSFTLPVGGVQTSLIIDGYLGKLSGLQTIDGKTVDTNETRREGSMFADGLPKSIVITVRKNRVQMVCDGQQLLDWTGDVSRLATDKLPYKDRIYLGDWYSRYRISKVELTPLSADAETEPPAVLAGKPIDVLKQIDPKRDAVAGDWQLVDGVLVTPNAPFSRLLLLAPPAAEYQLTIAGERVSGGYGLDVALALGGRQVSAAVDGVNGTYSGLSLIDGKDPSENETGRHGRLLVDGKAFTLVYTVRRKGVQVSLDGRLIVDWRGDPSRLSMVEGYRLPDTTRLALCEYQTVCRISKIELTPLSPEPEAKPPAVLAGEPIDVLKQIDLKRDAQWGEWRIEGSTLFAPAMPNSRLQAPVVPPDEYKLTLVAKGEPITRDIVLALPIAGRQALLVLDGWSGTPSALLQLVDGKPEPNNDTTVNHRVLADGENEIVCTVRKTSIDVECNGKRVIQWSGDPARLVNDRDVPSAKHLYLYSWSTPFRVSRFELTPLIENSSAVPAQPAPGVAGSSRPRNLGDLAAGAESRSPPPDEAAEKKARQEIRKTFAAELAAAKTPGEKRKLAEKFIKLADETRDDGASVYVLLREAAELGEAAGDLDLAWEAIDELARSHAIDAIAPKQQSLAEVGKAAKSPQQAREMADGACRLLADALAAGQPAAVKKIAAQAQSFAKRSKDAPLVKAVGIRTRDAAKWAAELAETTAARETLKTKPDDPGANLTVGRYELCAAKDWKQALPKLAKGGDADWRKIAKDELELARDPATPQRQIAAGDGWWTLAEKEAWPGRHYLRMRAAEWYRRARASLAAKDKARVDERLKALLADDDSLPAWDLFDVQGGQKRGGYVRLTQGVALRTPVEYGGPIEVAFEARTDGLNIRLYAHDREAVIWNWELNPKELRVTRPTGEIATARVEPLEANRWYKFHYVITPQGTSISVDGAAVFTDNRTYERFSASPVGVNGAGSTIDVKKLVVKPLD